MSEWILSKLTVLLVLVIPACPESLYRRIPDLPAGRRISFAGMTDL